LAREDDRLLAIGPELRLLDIEEWLATVHHLAIALNEEIGLLLGPRHLVIGLADQVFGRLHAGVAGNVLIAPQHDAIAVLPEDRVRDVRDNALQEGLLFPEEVLGPLPLRNVTDLDNAGAMAVEAELVAGDLHVDHGAVFLAVPPDPRGPILRGRQDTQ